MSSHTIALLYMLLLFSAWLLIPLVPAWITYKITPNQRLGLTGPFQQMTLRTSGAFAAYVILLLISYRFIAVNGMSIIGSMAAPSAWMLKADVIAIDEQGRRTRIPDTVKSVDVSFQPDLNRFGKNGVLIRLPYDPKDWQALTVTIPNFGGAEIDLSKLNNVQLDYFEKTAELQGPITVRKAQGGGLGVSPTL